MFWLCFSLPPTLVCKLCAATPEKEAAGRVLWPEGKDGRGWGGFVVRTLRCPLKASGAVKGPGSPAQLGEVLILSGPGFLTSG